MKDDPKSNTFDLLAHLGIDNNADAIFRENMRVFESILKETFSKENQLKVSHRFAQHEKNFKLMISQGWYPDFTSDLSDTYFTAEQYAKLADESLVKANEYLANHFEKIIENFDNLFSEQFSEKRKAIVRDAVNAHLRQEYNLSAPIFIIQSDGFTHEEYGMPTWGAGRSKPSFLVKAREENDKEEFACFREMLKPIISREMPFIASEETRIKTSYNPEIINRHRVLHGEDVEYGNKINSARAFSYLACNVFFMGYFIDK